MDISYFFWELLPINTLKEAKNLQRLDFVYAPTLQKLFNGRTFQKSGDSQHDTSFAQTLGNLDMPKWLKIHPKSNKIPKKRTLEKFYSCIKFSMYLFWKFFRTLYMTELCLKFWTNSKIFS